MQFHIWKVVTSRAFEYMIFAFITLNTITLAMQVSRRSCEAGVGVDHTQLVVFLKKLKNHDFYSVKFYRIFFKSTYWLPKVEEMFWCNKKSGVTELIFEIITRATYGGTESRFTDGSVVVLVFFFKSSFCNWLRAHAIFSAIEFFLSTWCGRLSWKSFLLPKIKYIELFDR